MEAAAQPPATLNLGRIAGMLATCMAINFVSLIPSTSVNVGLNAMMAALGMELATAQWVSTGWLAAATTTMLLSDYLISRFGPRASLRFCVLVFIATAVLGGLAQTPEMLIASRILQGAAIGPMSPLTMFLVFRSTPMRSRGMTMGIMATGVILAPTFGPVLGGWFTEELSWRWIFLSTVPMAALCLPAIEAVVPGQVEDAPPRMPLDLSGLVSMSAAIFLGLLAASWGPIYGWRSDQVLVTLAASGLLLLVFLCIEQRSPHPMVRLEIFRHRSFSIAAFLTLVTGTGLYASSYLLPLFVQTVQGMDTIDSGLIFILPGIVMALVFPLTGMLNDRIDARLALCAGLVLFGLSNLLFASVNAGTPTAHMVAWLLLGRIGLGMLMPSLTIANMASVPPQYLAQASGISNYTRNLGGALGVNILSIHLGLTYLRNLAQLNGETTWANPALREGVTALSLQPGALGMPHWDRFGLAFRWMWARSSQESLISAYQYEFLLVALVFFACIPLALMVRGRHLY